MKTKKILLLACVLCCFQNIQAQVSPYVFPEFVRATVLQKNGARMEAMMNYQKITREMLFIQDTKKIVLGNTEIIDTIFFGNRKFIPARAVFLEKLTNTRVALFVAHQARLISPNAKADNNNRVDNGNNKRAEVDKMDVYDLTYPEDYGIKEENIYWINSGLEYIPVTDIKKLSKAFPDKAKELASFIGDKKVDFHTKDDLVSLVTFLSN